MSQNNCILLVITYNCWFILCGCSRWYSRKDYVISRNCILTIYDVSCLILICRELTIWHAIQLTGFICAKYIHLWLCVKCLKTYPWSFTAQVDFLSSSSFQLLSSIRQLCTTSNVDNFNIRGEKNLASTKCVFRLKVKGNHWFF